MKLSFISKTTLLVFALACFSLTLNAQAPDGDGPKGPGKEKIEHKVNRIAKELNLDAEQTAELLKIERDFKEKARALRPDSDVVNQDRSEAEAQLKTLRAEHRQSLQSVLTPEQMKQYRDLRAQNRPPKKARIQQGQ
ncbi:MAG: hypothetical protein AAGG75_05405 [Bacteroidota bacterium]